MIFKQLYLACLSQASYLVGDETTGAAAVIDPRRDVAPYLAEAQALGLRIEHVLLTHFHADFVSGHLELLERTGATIHLSHRAAPAYPHATLREGDRLRLGSVELRVLETPGHTPESLCYVVYADADDAHPYGVCTGDTLFIGDVGRPDLMASAGITAEALAGQLYDSTRRLLELPDATRLYPGHGAGSSCGKNLSSETVCTIGRQRATNYALQPMERDDFVRLVTANQPPAPAYFSHDAQLNREVHPTLDVALAAAQRELTLEDALRRQTDGAVLLDVRGADVAAAGHLAGSLVIGLDGRFASWAGTLIPPKTPIVLVCAADAVEEAATRLGRIGFDQVAGWLPPATFVGRAHDLISFPRVQAADSAPLAGSCFVLDVRTPGEWEAGHLAGSTNLPLATLKEHLDQVPRDRPLLVHCQGGYRSATAASLLLDAGITQLTDMAGGFAAWRAAGLDTE